MLRDYCWFDYTYWTIFIRMFKHKYVRQFPGKSYSECNLSHCCSSSCMRREIERESDLIACLDLPVDVLAMSVFLSSSLHRFVIHSSRQPRWYLFWSLAPSAIPWPRSVYIIYAWIDASQLQGDWLFLRLHRVTVLPPCWITHCVVICFLMDAPICRFFPRGLSAVSIPAFEVHLGSRRSHDA